MPTAVVVMDYGSPASPAEVEAYYTDIRRGRPPSPEQLADLERRYAAIGGVSPLAERTRAQVVALGRALEGLAPGRFLTYHGSKHASPRIEEAVAAAARDGARGLVGLVLAPHYSALSVGEYVERAAKAAQDAAIAARFVEHWHDDPTLVALLAARLDDARRQLAAPWSEVEVVFSAHSLPARIVELRDPYPDQLEETARLVARAAGVEHFRTAWQSAGRTGEPWLGPDITAVIDDLAREGRKGVLVAPVGFTSDHLEILYDLDIDARARAQAQGLAFARTASLNDEPQLFEALAARVLALADELA